MFMGLKTQKLKRRTKKHIKFGTRSLHQHMFLRDPFGGCFLWLPLISKGSFQELGTNPTLLVCYYYWSLVFLVVFLVANLVVSIVVAFGCVVLLFWLLFAWEVLHLFGDKDRKGRRGENKEENNEQYQPYLQALADNNERDKIKKGVGSGGQTPSHKVTEE